MAFGFVLLLSSFITPGTAIRAEDADLQANDAVVDFAAHLEDFSHLSTNTQNCDTPEIRAAAEVYERKLFVGRSGSQTPKAVLMVGGPGSGKSTGRRLIASDDEYAIMDVDDILKDVYKPDADTYYDCYKPAMVYYRKWMAALVENKIDLVVDGTGRAFDRYIRFATELKQASYTNEIVSVILPFQVAKKRMEKRAKIENRVVDVKYAEGVYKDLETVLPRYLQEALIDTVYVFSNDVPEGTSPELLLKKSPGSVQCHFKGRENAHPLFKALSAFC